jgi:hypothetical protein
MDEILSLQCRALAQAELDERTRKSKDVVRFLLGTRTPLDEPIREQVALAHIVKGGYIPQHLPMTKEERAKMERMIFEASRER